MREIFETKNEKRKHSNVQKKLASSSAKPSTRTNEIIHQNEAEDHICIFHSNICLTLVIITFLLHWGAKCISLSQIPAEQSGENDIVISDKD
jgi:hypothetical protein